MELKKLKEVEVLGHNVKMVWSKKVQGGTYLLGQMVRMKLASALQQKNMTLLM